MTTYAYCRVSTKHQSIDRQIRNITEQYPDAVIVKESYTGTKMDRPNWTKLMKRVQAGDRIVFDEVSRMSRNSTEGTTVYFQLMDRDVDLVFLREPAINTAVYKQAIEKAIPMTNTTVDLILTGVNAYLKELAKEQIRLAFEQAQKERDDLSRRTKGGIATARLNGEQIGLVKGTKLNVKKQNEAIKFIKERSKDFGGDLNDTECMTLAGVSRNSFYKYKRMIKETA